MLRRWLCQLPQFLHGSVIQSFHARNIAGFFCRLRRRDHAEAYHSRRDPSHEAAGQKLVRVCIAHAARLIWFHGKKPPLVPRTSKDGLRFLKTTARQDARRNEKIVFRLKLYRFCDFQQWHLGNCFHNPAKIEGE